MLAYNLRELGQIIRADLDGRNKGFFRIGERPSAQTKIQLASGVWTAVMCFPTSRLTENH
jgi:hypothetical protein